MNRILNNFTVNFYALIGLSVAIALSTAMVFREGIFPWSITTVLLVLGINPLVDRLHRINRNK